MHEVISMVEDLARALKGMEGSVNNKREETEMILLNLANMQRKIDEN